MSHATPSRVLSTSRGGRERSGNRTQDLGAPGACDLSLLAGFELLTVWKAERGPGDSNKLLPVLVWHRRAVLERLIRIMHFSFCRIESRDEGSSLAGHQSPGFFLASPPLTTFQTYTRMNRVGKEIEDTKRRQLGSKPQTLLPRHGLLFFRSVVAPTQDLVHG